MRTILASIVATSLMVSSTFAASPLPAGKAAGTKEAAMLGPQFALILLGAGIVIGGIALAVSNNGGDGVTTPTTTASSTTGLP